MPTNSDLEEAAVWRDELEASFNHGLLTNRQSEELSPFEEEQIKRAQEMEVEAQEMEMGRAQEMGVHSQRLKKWE